MLIIINFLGLNRGISSLTKKQVVALQLPAFSLNLTNNFSQVNPLSFMIILTCCNGALWLVHDNECEMREDPEISFGQEYSFKHHFSICLSHCHCL